MIKTDKIIADRHVDAKGNDMFVSQNGGTIYYKDTKWFTTTQSITIAADGLSATAAGAQFTAGTSHLAAKLIVDGVERIITTPNPTTTVVYVTEAFPAAMRGQTYTSEQWGVYPIGIILDSTGNFKIFSGAQAGGAGVGTLLATNDSGYLKTQYGFRAWTNVFYDFGISFAQTASIIKWGSDLGTGRNAAGVLEINNGTAGTFRDLIARQYRIGALNTAPASATDTGTLGEIRYTADYIYVCVATNTWKRTALETW